MRQDECNPEKIRKNCQIIEVNSAMHQLSRKLFVVAEKEIEQVVGKGHSVKLMFSEKATKYEKKYGRYF